MALRKPYINYGYDQSGSITYSGLTAKRNGIYVTVNGSTPTYAVRVRLNGTLERSPTLNGTKAWTNGLNLIPGHRYRLYLTKISGTVDASDADLAADIMPTMLYFIEEGSANRINSKRFLSEDIMTGSWVANSLPVHLVLILQPKVIFTNAVYKILVEDASLSTEFDPGIITEYEESFFSIAAQAYRTGDLIILNNSLYKVTANIADGAAITVGTNVEKTTLSDLLK